MPYSEVTLASLADLLAQALGDEAQRFWSPAELRALVREALRTWNVFTAYWREGRQFQTSPTDYVYDLTQVGTGGGVVLELNSSPGDILNDVQFALMEPFVDFVAAPNYSSFTT